MRKNGTPSKWSINFWRFFIQRFSYHDGVIDELCPELTEPNWVMNLKRGILSSFQNSMKRFDIDFKSTETDISGTCDVQYVVKGAQDTSFLIKKEKDISSCINRYKTNSVLQTTPYDFRKQYSVLPILQSTSHCDVSNIRMIKIINTNLDRFLISIYKKKFISRLHLIIAFTRPYIVVSAINLYHFQTIRPEQSHCLQSN